MVGVAATGGLVGQHLAAVGLPGRGAYRDRTVVAQRAGAAAANLDQGAGIAIVLVAQGQRREALARAGLCRGQQGGGGKGLRRLA